MHLSLKQSAAGTGGRASQHTQHRESVEQVPEKLNETNSERETDGKKLQLVGGRLAKAATG